MLFFLLPFYWKSTTLDAANAWFVIVLARLRGRVDARHRLRSGPHALALAGLHLPRAHALRLPEPRHPGALARHAHALVARGGGGHRGRELLDAARDDAPAPEKDDDRPLRPHAGGGRGRCLRRAGGDPSRADVRLVRGGRPRAAPRRAARHGGQDAAPLGDPGAHRGDRRGRARRQGRPAPSRVAARLARGAQDVRGDVAHRRTQGRRSPAVVADGPGPPERSGGLRGGSTSRPKTASSSAAPNSRSWSRRSAPRRPREAAEAAPLEASGPGSADRQRGCDR